MAARRFWKSEVTGVLGILFGLVSVFGAGTARADCAMDVSPKALGLVSFDGTYYALGSGSIVATVNEPGCLIIGSAAGESGYFPFGSPLSESNSGLPAWINTWSFWDNGAELPYEPYSCAASVTWASFNVFDGTASVNNAVVTLTVIPT